MGVICLSIWPSHVAAESIWALQKLHDYERGPELIEQFFKEAWKGDAHARFQSFGCTSDNSLYEREGRRDERPVEVARIKLLGEPRARSHPTYLVAGSRAAWFENHGSFVELPCVWLISFDGNQVRSVREAGELGHLLQSDLKD